MSATVETPPLGSCGRITTTANLLAGATRGVLQVAARSLGGYGQVEQCVAFDGSPLRAMPEALLALLEDTDGWEMRIGVAVRSSGAATLPIALNVAFASWRFPTEYGAPGGGAARYYVADEHVDRVRAALERFSVPPTILVDAANEVAVCWRLDAPLCDMARARGLQRALAAALGADVDERPQPGTRPAVPADDPGVFLPLAGIVRNMGAADPPVITLPVVDATRAYSIHTFEHAIADLTERVAPRKKASRA